MSLDERFQQTVLGVADSGGGEISRPRGHVGELKYNSVATGETTMVMSLHFYDLEEEGLPKLGGREGWVALQVDTCGSTTCNKIRTY